MNFPFIPQQNVATALVVIEALGIELNSEKVNAWIASTQVAGRTERFIVDEREIILDVGHNPHATRYLAEFLNKRKTKQAIERIFAVVGMLADKDIVGSLSPLIGVIDNWHLVSLSVPRGASSAQLSQALSQVLPEALPEALTSQPLSENQTPVNDNVNCFDNVIDGYKMALAKANKNDLIIVFGSFYTVAEIRNLLI